jgi:hypothetical protein
MRSSDFLTACPQVKAGKERNNFEIFVSLRNTNKKKQLEMIIIASFLFLFIFVEENKFLQVENRINKDAMR